MLEGGGEEYKYLQAGAHKPEWESGRVKLMNTLGYVFTVD